MTAAGFLGVMWAAHRAMGRRRLTAWREQSWLLLAVVVVFVLSYGVGGYVFVRWGIEQLARFPGLGNLIVERVLFVFFAFLLVMLFFSNLIIGYAALYKSPETQWLLTLPVRREAVFLYKLAETQALASWAFLFLAAPLMLAYGVARDVAWSFYPLVAALFVPFTMIPAAAGMLVALTAARWLDRRAFKVALLTLGVVALAGMVWLVQPRDASQWEQAQLVESLNRLLRGSRVAMQPLLPSYWVAGAVVAWSEGPWWRGWFLLLVVVSNALLAWRVCHGLSRRWFYEAWSRNHSQDNERALHPARVGRTPVLEAVVARVPGLRVWTRALMVKDIRVFWRDTAQWSQFVVFFGLLGLYVLNLRPSSYGGEAWRMFVAFLNLGATSMTLATLSTRFVYPQFSLEGKRLWIVGMAPCGLKHVLREKFWLSSTVAATITLALVLVSGWKLELPGWVVLLFAATTVLMSCALCGIAVGVGALFPNFGSGGQTSRREDNPARIVSGFGGTFCFVLSLVYILLVMAAEAWPLYLYLVRAPLGHAVTPWAAVIVGCGVAALSVAGAVVPMRLALRRVKNLEV